MVRFENWLQIRIRDDKTHIPWKFHNDANWIGFQKGKNLWLGHFSFISSEFLNQSLPLYCLPCRKFWWKYDMFQSNYTSHAKTTEFTWNSCFSGFFKTWYLFCLSSNFNLPFTTDAQLHFLTESQIWCRLRWNWPSEWQKAVARSHSVRFFPFFTMVCSTLMPSMVSILVNIEACQVQISVNRPKNEKKNTKNLTFQNTFQTILSRLVPINLHVKKVVALPDIKNSQRIN